jgi:hypothetical protein
MASIVTLGVPVPVTVVVVVHRDVIDVNPVSAPVSLAIIGMHPRSRSTVVVVHRDIIDMDPVVAVVGPYITVPCGRCPHIAGLIPVPLAALVRRYIAAVIPGSRSVNRVVGGVISQSGHVIAVAVLVPVWCVVCIVDMGSVVPSVVIVIGVPSVPVPVYGIVVRVIRPVVAVISRVACIDAPAETRPCVVPVYIPADVCRLVGIPIIIGIQWSVVTDRYERSVKAFQPGGIMKVIPVVVIIIDHQAILRTVFVVVVTKAPVLC